MDFKNFCKKNVKVFFNSEEKVIKSNSKIRINKFFKYEENINMINFLNKKFKFNKNFKNIYIRSYINKNFNKKNLYCKYTRDLVTKNATFFFEKFKYKKIL